ncbi:MAG: TetR/AcrR family transcriptional regulator [Spirochaetes bacterium]|uniref:TetR/AcrR family transcriptional regulator n=1 Tax=Candidatus Ornithospirochaeta stercoripullorum TaxID=2840899 RepID=A0A9D9DZZ7_9SPIO|nr:TetR/AcrR family transcriptional regulator [Candidatus Ornithospirochaeta stercoripullorum]
MKTSRDIIIRKATEIIAFSGLDKLTMNTLSEELGINKASLYHWFSSKDEILDEVFREGHKALMAKGFRLELDGSATQVLSRIAAKWTDIFSDDSLLPYLRTVFSLRYSDERAEEEASALSLMLRSQVSVIMNALGENDEFLTSLFSSLLLVHLQSMLDGNDEDLELDAKAFASLLEKS